MTIKQGDIAYEGLLNDKKPIDCTTGELVTQRAKKKPQTYLGLANSRSTKAVIKMKAVTAAEVEPMGVVAIFIP